MYSTTDFRKGLKIEIDGTPFEIIEFQHFKPGKGGAMVRTKLRNILNGRVLDNTFRSGEKVERPNLESRDMQFLYHEGEQLVFMDMTTYDQMHMDAEATDGKANYLKDGQECRVLLYNEKPLDIEIPASLVLEVTETEPGAKGDTVSQRDQARHPRNRRRHSGSDFREHRGPLSRSIPAPTAISAANNAFSGPGPASGPDDPPLQLIALYLYHADKTESAGGGCHYGRTQDRPGTVWAFSYFLGTAGALEPGVL